MISATSIYNELKTRFSAQEIANKLNLHIGTLKRWESNQKIPNDYLYDLNFLLDNKYALNKENFRSHNEFFTKKKIAKHCFDKFILFLKNHRINVDEYVFIEPSCGDLSFYNLMPEHNRIGIDLAYKNDSILCQNFLSFKPEDSNKKYLILGNPPFGLRGNLALRFINHAKFADFIAFILPPLFNSDGKGAPKKRVEHFNLAFSQKLPLNSFIYPNGKEVCVATLFQIWVNKNVNLNLNIEPPKTCKDYIKIYSLSDGGTPSSTRNKNMLYKCDLYLPSTCFNSKGKLQMKIYYDFESLPHRRGYGIVILRQKDSIKRVLESINWEKISFLGTNSSLNLRTSLIENALIDKGFCDRRLF